MKLKEYREAVGVSFSDAADSLEISKSQLSRYETGQSIPRPDLMIKIKEWSKGCVQPNDFYKAVSGSCGNDSKL